MTLPWFHDARRGLSIYPRSDILRQRIPEVRDINGQYVAVPHTLQNAQTLRWLQYPVAPVITDYDWPAPPGVKPYESQKLVANFLVTHPRCFNLSDMGTGKTNATLWGADWLMRQHPPGTCRCLVVAPLSILETVWANAIFKNFLGHRKIEILHGDHERRVKALARPADFYVINFDGVGVGARADGKGRISLEGFSKLLSERSDIKIAVVDEASAYKDARTRRHRIARLVFGKKEYLWGLSGTPVPNAPTDAFGLAKLVNNAYGKSFTGFRMETMYKLPMSEFRWVPLKDGYEKARRLLTPAIRIDIASVWDAPPSTTQVRRVELTSQQKKLMADLKRDLVMQVKQGVQILAINEASLRIKFMQISAGAVYDENHAVHFVDAEPRLSEIETVISETSRKVVIFAGLTSVVDLLYKRLSKRWACAVLNGDVPMKERTEIIRRFGVEEDSLRIAICDPQATAHGINSFVTADTCIWAVPTDKTELYLQGIKRLVRPGQTGPVTVVQLISNPLEQEIFKRLEHNESMQGALLAAIERENW